MSDFRARQRVQIHDGTNEFGVLNSKAIFVQPTDGTNDLDYVVINSAFGSTPVAIPIAGKYESSPTTYGDGDAVPFLTDANGRLQTNLTISYEFTDDAAFTVGTSKVAAIGAMADEAATDSVDEGDIGIPRMTLDRKLIVSVPDTITVDLGATDNAVLDAIAASLVDVETNTDFGAVVGGGTEATALRVTIANDSTGVLTIDDGGGAITVDGTVVVSSITADVSIDDGGNSITVDASNLDIRDLTHVSDSVTIGDGTETMNVTAAGEAEVDIAAQSLTALKVSKDANANSDVNPIFVQDVSGAVVGTEIHDYDTSAAVAKDATDNHDYAVTGGKTLMLSSVIVAASGAMKCELQVGPAAGLATMAVLFTSGAKPTEQIIFDPPIEIPDTSTGTVRIIRQNDDHQAMDVYSTIIGAEVS